MTTMTHHIAVAERSAAELHPAVAQRLAQLPSIGLASLVERAELQTRVDRKYVIRTSVLAALLYQLSDSTAVLQIDGRRHFGYQSVYFDTADVRCFRDHQQGKRRRFKVRTRTYVDSDETMFEVKSVGSRGETVKSRLPYEVADAHRWTNAARDFTSKILGDADIAAQLRPTLTTTYRRATLFDGAARITIDAGLAFQMVPGIDYRAPEDTVIVETKSAHGRSLADTVLRQMGARPESVSKYCVGVALFHPHLPASRWRRTIRRSFLGLAPQAQPTLLPERGAHCCEGKATELAG